MRALILALSALLVGMLTARASDNPKAANGAVVVAGKARFTVLTPQLIRMEWSADGVFEDRASLVFTNRLLPVPTINLNETAEELTITTDKLVLRYKKGDGHFTADNLSVRMVFGNSFVVWKPGMIDTLNLGGTTRTLDGTNGAKDVQLEQGILSRSGWALVDDSPRPLFDGSDWSWVTPRPKGDRQDWYFFGYGHDYKKALYDFTRVAGKIPMPPKFAFGYWWSRYWTYSDAELRGLIADMRRYEVPIDVLIIDMDWHETYGLSVHGTKRDPFGQSVGWTGYTWNTSLFPDPARFLQWTKDEHLNTALNLHPASGIAPMESQYADFARQIGFDTTGKKNIPFAVEDKQWSQAYMDVVLHPLERQGIDFWWLDWQAWLDNKKIAGLSNTWWLNYVFFSSMERDGKKRPLLFHRWGGLGNHRYQIGFSGDSWSTWEALAYQPAFTATASNVGYGYWSHDIGGHLGNDPDPELYLRWIQWGVLSPILRTHSTKSSEIERRIWKYNDLFPVMRKAFEFRYALVPYIYTASRKAYDTGVSLCRPLYYDFPERPEAYAMKGEYMFGDDLLVAPVTSKADPVSGLAGRSVWLPPGAWYEYFSGSLLTGDRTVERTFALDEIPLYARAGAVIPMYPKIMNLQEPIDTLRLVFIPGGAGEATVYEDDGATSAYQSGAFARTKVSQRTEGGKRILEIAPREGTFAGAPEQRTFRIELPGTLPPGGVTVNGSAYAMADAPAPGVWRYDASSLTTLIDLPPTASGKPIEVVVAAASDGTKEGALLDGMRGLFSRLPKIVQMMKDEVNRHDQIANAPPLVLRLGSLPTRIAYQPTSAASEISGFRGALPELFGQIMNFPRGEQRALRAIVAQFPFETNIAAEPSIHIDTTTSPTPVRATITAPEGYSVRYTLDGGEPTEESQIYAGPLTLASTTHLRAKSFAPGKLPSFSATAEFHRVTAKSVELADPYSPRYAAAGPLSLVDGTFGNPENYRSDWLGFQQSDVVATVTLLQEKSISSITVRFLRDQESWIFLPVRLTFEVSSDGVKYRKVHEIDLSSVAAAEKSGTEAESFKASFQPTKAKFVRVSAVNIRTCPSWHAGAGGKAWLFTDEIVIE